VPTSVIRNAVDVHRLEVRRSRAEMRRAWGVPPGSLVAGYLGRLSAEKDPHAMRRMIGHLPDDWHGVLVGSGAERIQPHPRLHLVGTDPAAGDVLSAFDVLVVPSHYESFGLTMAEGLWAGVPVVSTEVGIARLEPGLTRVIPVDADGPTLARAILDDQADMRGTAERTGAGKLFARERLSPDRFGREWTDLILATAPARPAPRLAAAVRDAVIACEHRGPEGGLVLLEDERSCCGGGEERTACAAGKGRRPGRVTLRECLACKSA
jgi:glycosyltransferase involved in cell wall biosynthesis